MLCDISFFSSKFGTQTPELTEPVRFEVIFMECAEDDEKALIAYEADPQVYDSGKTLTVVYRRNITCPDATENQLLALDPVRDDKEYAVLEVLESILPDVSQWYDTVTRITLETQEKLTAAISEDLEEIVSYLPVPADLSHIPRVSINELKKIKYLDTNVDLIRWKGQDFAYKKTERESLEGTIQELIILDKLRDSPYIIDLIAIVINADNQIRGFLMPYMIAGDVPNVFREGRRSQDRTDDDESELIFDWSLKLSWARQPTNVLLNSSGQAILIDFLPVGVTNEFAAPELLEKFHDATGHTTFQSVLTASVDIYSLGLLLYAIAREKVYGTLLLLEFEGIPAWYRDIIERCTTSTPVDRPPAKEVLYLLQQGDK